VNIVSLFSGCGGLDLGLTKAGHTVIWANDIFFEAIETYRNNIGHHVDTRDIRLIPSSDIPDCDNPDAPDWIVRNVGSLSMSISGNGVVASSNIEVWMGAFETASPAKVKVEIVFPDKKVTYTGEMQLESVEIAGTHGDTVSLNVSMQSNGEMVRVVTAI